MRFGILVVSLALVLTAPAMAGEADGPPPPARGPETPTEAGAAPACATPPAAVLPVSTGGITGQAYCEADCKPGAGTQIISCSGSTCRGVDSSCSPERTGFVECDGRRTFCRSPDCGTSCAGFDYSQCEPLYSCEQICLVGGPGYSVGHECCQCECTGFSSCPLCLMPS